MAAKRAGMTIVYTNMRFAKPKQNMINSLNLGNSFEPDHPPLLDPKEEEMTIIVRKAKVRKVSMDLKKRQVGIFSAKSVWIAQDDHHHLVTVPAKRSMPQKNKLFSV